VSDSPTVAPIVPESPPPPPPPPPEAQGTPGVSFYETEPDSITWHKIWDFELEGLVNIARPIVLGLSTTFLGAAIGLLPTVRDTFGKLKTPGALGDGDLVMLIVAGACLAGAIAFGFFAVRGQWDAHKLKTKIQGRNPRQIGHGPGGAGATA
jgi:hypothetical protein